MIRGGGAKITPKGDYMEEYDRIMASRKVFQVFPGIPANTKNIAFGP
jgi:hypothetical protein